MNLHLKRDPDTGESFIDVDQLVDFFEDVSILDSYKLTYNEDSSITLVFFDKNANPVMPKNYEKK